MKVSKSKAADNRDAILQAAAAQMRGRGLDQTSIADLGSKVQDLLSKKTGSKMVFFRSDARAHYGTVMDAIDAVRTTGVDEVGLLTENRQPGNKPPTGGGE